MNKKILIVVHQEHSTPGRVGRKLVERGYDLDIRRPCLGHELPPSTQDFDGVVVFGGPMSANDGNELPFIKDEVDWLAVPLKEKTPFLGICLGAQMLALHLGARVCVHERGCAEIGYYPINATSAGKALFDWPDHVYQWHREGFELPAGAQLLATGPGNFTNQAFRCGETAYGIQFHPEVTLAMMHRWTVRAFHRFVLEGVRPRESHFTDRLMYDHGVETWLDSFLTHWLDLNDVADRASAA
ncbi:MAG: glutamine amidotransferase [Hyphomicrobiales bacterium]|nr:glutamine amidotransferase [Hyphomicrobiales bacterium]